MLSLSCMLQLELPHINVVTKCDLADKTELERILDAESGWAVAARNATVTGRMKRLTEALCGVIDDYMMVSFAMLDPNDEDSIELVLAQTDHAIQYGEDLEPKEVVDYDEDEDGEDEAGQVQERGRPFDSEY
jgi:hypothetical protein